jgi:hypothetical protein
MNPLQSLPAVFDAPEPYAALVIVIVAIVMWQRTLSWREYRRLHALKRRVLPLVDRHTGLFVVSRKGGRDDDEWLCSPLEGVPDIYRQLVDAGFSPHLVNALKVRTIGGENQYSAAHLVYFHDDGMQTEVYLFAAPDGGTDVYAHVESGVHTPKDHLEGDQKDGDKRNVVRDAL